MGAVRSYHRSPDLEDVLHGKVRNLALRALADVIEQGVEVRARLPYPTTQLAKSVGS